MRYPIFNSNQQTERSPISNYKGCLMTESTLYSTSLQVLWSLEVFLRLLVIEETMLP